MQRNGNEYGMPRDPMMQGRPQRYETQQHPYAQGAQYPYMEDAYAPRQAQPYSQPARPQQQHVGIQIAGQDVDVVA